VIEVDFREIVLRRFPGIAAGSFPAAFAGQQVLDAGQTTPSLADYHLTILHGLGIGRAPPRLLRELKQPGARPLVEPFPEVPDVLERLRARGVRMAIVSDSWPGPEGLYRQLGLHQYFQDPELVAAAIELGYGGTTITRAADPPPAVPWITSLEDLPLFGT
jgi:putative hydrolase of the HAD superfamily